LERTPIRPRSLNPGLPAKLEEIIDTALEKDRELRCQAAAELRADLKRLMRDMDSARAKADVPVDFQEAEVGQKPITSPASSLQGLAWAPSGEEIWFTAAHVGNYRGLFAVTLSGREQLVAQVPGVLTLHDIGRDGRLLLSQENWRREVFVDSADGKEERNLRLDWSFPTDLSADGKTLLFEEQGEGGGHGILSTYERQTERRRFDWVMAEPSHYHRIRGG
jgi:hypothetical protein